MDEPRYVEGAHRIELLRARRSPADIDAGDGASLAEDDGATGESIEVGGVANLYSGDVSDPLQHR